MLSSEVLYTLVIAAALAVGYHVFSTIRFNRRYKLPPFVKGGVPLFGNAFQLPPVGHEAGEVVRKWADEYGEM
jgi:hypothetical protein